MSGMVGMGTTPFGDEDSFLKGFTVSLSWDYPDDYSLKDVQDTVFYVYDEDDSQRSESQYICDCVQSSGAGVLLLKPHPETNNIPCEMHFKAHSSITEFCMIKIFTISEAKHLELYLDDIYEKTSKGCMLTVKKGKKLSLYENVFDLSSHALSSNKISIKFLSLGENVTMRLQAAIVKVIKRTTNKQHNQVTPSLPFMNSSSIDINGVREMLDSMGLSVPNGADKIMSNIEHQQKQIQMSQLQGMASVGMMAQLQNITQQQQTIQQQTQSMQILQMLSQPSNITSLPGVPNMTQPGMNPMQQLLLGQMQAPSSSNPSSSTSRGASRSASPRQNGHVSPENKYPLSRESVSPPRSRRASASSTVKSHSYHSLDQFDGFGAPNPPSQSILSNAIKNEDKSRKLAHSRASLIEEQNIETVDSEYEKTQIELVKNFLRSQDSSAITIKKIQSKKPDKPVRGRPHREGWSKKQRPHSMSALPSASEADFTKLLSGLMDQELKGEELHHGELKEEFHHRDDDELSLTTAPGSSRWEAYLRSRIRASQRLSSAGTSRPDSECFSDLTDRDQFASLKHSSQHSAQNIHKESNRCYACGCPGCSTTYNALTTELSHIEQRMTERLELKLQGIQDHLDSRIDQIYGFVASQQHQQQHHHQRIDDTSYNYVSDTTAV